MTALSAGQQVLLLDVARTIHQAKVKAGTLAQSAGPSVEAAMLELIANALGHLGRFTSEITEPLVDQYADRPDIDPLYCTRCHCIKDHRKDRGSSVCCSCGTVATGGMWLVGGGAL